LLQTRFFAIVRDHLPKKLDFDSWIGQIARQKVEMEEGATLSPGHLGMWEPWMSQSMPGRPKKYIPFLGTGGNGGLVWVYNQWGVPTGKSPGETARHREIERLMARTEEPLVRLSIQIANWLGSFIAAHRAQAQLNARWTGADVVEAVVEILGDEWFELPVDTAGKLQEWKYQRTLCLPQEQYNSIVTG
jgi:hypothetical protein